MGHAACCVLLVTNMTGDGGRIRMTEDDSLVVDDSHDSRNLENLD